MGKMSGANNNYYRDSKTFNNTIRSFFCSSTTSCMVLQHAASDPLHASGPQHEIVVSMMAADQDHAQALELVPATTIDVRALRGVRFVELVLPGAMLWRRPPLTIANC